MPSSRVAIALCFLLGLVVLDRGVGLVLGAAVQRVQGGQTIGGANRALAQLDAELVVFGSSRAARHVDPELLHERLGLDAYNAGALGQGLPYARMLAELLLTRDSAARVFVLQVDPQNLYIDDTDRAMLLAAYLGESPAVDAILRGSSWTAPIKLLSHSYRYNSLALRALRNWFAPGRAAGFRPHQEELDPELVEGLGPLVVLPPDPDRAATRRRMEGYFREFVQTAKQAGVWTLVVVSPSYKGGLSRQDWEIAGLARIAELAEEERAGFVSLDEESQPVFDDPSLFRDRGHLNARGARLFTLMLANAIADRAPAAAIAPARRGMVRSSAPGDGPGSAGATLGRWSEPGLDSEKEMP